MLSILSNRAHMYTSLFEKTLFRSKYKEAHFGKNEQSENLVSEAESRLNRGGGLSKLLCLAACSDGSKDVP